MSGHEIDLGWVKSCILPADPKGEDAECIMALLGVIHTLDERIARFETGAAYEREEVTPQQKAKTALAIVKECGKDNSLTTAQIIESYRNALTQIANMES